MEKIIIHPLLIYTTLSLQTGNDVEIATDNVLQDLSGSFFQFLQFVFSQRVGAQGHTLDW